jgi:O-antigen ligase
MIRRLRFFLAFFIIAAANQFFSLGDWWHRPGAFNIADVGNGLAMVLMAWGVLFSRDPTLLRNTFAVPILLYIFMVLVHVSLAGFYYDQGIVQSLIGARHQFYYLSFFAFLVLLRSQEDVLQFLNLIAILAVVLFLLSIVNYLGPTIYSHQWAEGHGERSGVERGFIPAMGVVSFALIWVTARWAERGKVVSPEGLGAIVLFGAHVFRQTRSRLIAVSVVLVALLVYKKRFRALAVIGGMAFVAGAIVMSASGSNMVVELFKSSYEDVVEESGTWVGRAKQLEIAWQEFQTHPLIGSGASVLRSGDAGPAYDPKDDPAALGYKGDLGYAKWLASYGLLGVGWFIMFTVLLVKGIIRTGRLCVSGNGVFPAFVASYFGFVAISYITINHFMQPSGIVLITLALVALVRSQQAVLAERAAARAMSVAESGIGQRESAHALGRRRVPGHVMRHPR